MSNNYLQFSECLKIPSAEALAWTNSQLDTSGLEDEPPRKYDWERDDPDLEEFSNGFSWSIEANPDGSSSLWIYAEEHGNLCDVASFVQAFLRRFLPNGVWTMTYSQTCSRLRVGEFSGGAIVVTAEEIESLDAGTWAVKMARSKQRSSANST